MDSRSSSASPSKVKLILHPPHRVTKVNCRYRIPNTNLVKYHRDGKEHLCAPGRTPWEKRDRKMINPWSIGIITRKCKEFRSDLGSENDKKSSSAQRNLQYLLPFPPNGLSTKSTKPSCLGTSTSNRPTCSPPKGHRKTLNLSTLPPFKNVSVSEPRHN